MAFGVVSFIVGFSRSEFSLTTGAEEPLLGLWDPVIGLGFGCALAGLLGLLIARLWHDPEPHVSPQGERPWLRSGLAWLCLAGALVLSVLSSLAFEEGYRDRWRTPCNIGDGPVPAKYQSLGVFDGDWIPLSKLSYHIYLGCIVCYFAWLAARAWSRGRSLPAPEAS